MRQLTYRVFTIACLFLLTVCSVQAKRVCVPKMYMFGFAASFNDTIVHFTDVQAVDSTWIETKNKFLLQRDTYSRQLRSYLNNQGMPHRTCIVIFDKKRSKLEKKYLKMKRLYSPSKDGIAHYDVRDLKVGEFTFKSSPLNEESETATKKKGKVKAKVNVPNPVDIVKENAEKKTDKAFEKEMKKRQKAEEKRRKAGEEIKARQN